MRCAADTGQRQFTVMPNLPHSRAAERVRARIASFDDAYGAYPTAPRSAAFEPMVTIRPRPWSRMCGNTACMPQSVPLGPVSSSTSMSCSVISANGVTDRNVCALATRPSTRPNSVRVRSTSANTPSRSATLRVVDRWGAPIFCSSAAVSSSASGLRAVITSVAPARARWSAIPRPHALRCAGDDDDVPVDRVVDAHAHVRYLHGPQATCAVRPRISAARASASTIG